MSLRSLRSGLRRLTDKDGAERDLVDEVDHYLAMAVEEHIKRGLPRAEAERRARVELGGVEAVKETVRGGGWEVGVESAWRDIKYAWRGLRRNPMFAFVAAATLALGIGANTAMFTVVNAVMLRPLPYLDQDRLVLLWTDDIKRGLHRENTAYRTIADWQQQTNSFADIAFFNAGRVTLGQGDTRERSRSASVSANLFALLGTPPLKGRWITAQDDGAAVVVISYRLWQRRFATAADVIGKTLIVDQGGAKESAAAPTIVGVMPAGFYFPDKQTELWTPATAYWRWARESSERFPEWARRWTAIARLKSTVSIADARADLSRIGDQLTAAYPSNVPDFPGFAVNVVPILEYVTGSQLPLELALLMGAVGLVLLVACANVGNLLLARGAARQDEFALRRALGAGRLRLVQQLMAESLTLAILSGLIGILVAGWATGGLGAAAANRIPRLDEISIDVRVLAFAVGVSLISGALFGLLPALRATAAQSLRTHRARGFLIVVECSVAVVLLVGAGLLVRSLAHVRSVDPGFDPAHVLLTRVEFPPDAAPAAATADASPARARAREQAMQNLLERVATLGNIEAAGFVDDMFISGQGNESITFPGLDPAGIPSGELNAAAVTPEFFKAAGVPLRAGRYLQRDDALTKIQALWTPAERGLSLNEQQRRAIAEPVVVNDAFVRRFLPGKDPIGERFCIDPTGKTYWYVIVGVVGDMRRKGLEQQAIPEYFGPLLPSPASRADLLVRTRGNPADAAGTVRGAVRTALPGALIPTISTADQQLGDFIAQRTLQTWLLALFAAVALALAAIGIYGVVHYTVARRTREIGIRIALGARRQDVVRNVVAGGMRLPMLGLAIGLILSAGLTGLVSHLLFEVRSIDPLTFAAVPATLVAVILVACYVPARRASRIDAVAALREG